MKYSKGKIGIVIPCYNEEENVDYIVNGVNRYLEPTGYDYEFIFIDDGSSDGTYDKILNLSKEKSNINIIKFSRNFGKEAALTAGLKYCNFDAAVIIDSDLQHPPYLLPFMISEWEKGAKIVDAVKIRRQRESMIIRGLSLAFNKAMTTLTGMDFDGASDYKLLDKKVIDILNGVVEKTRFFRGLTNWTGFEHSKIEFKVENRRAGKTKWNRFKLFRLSLDAITSYSSKPLQAVTLLGVITLIFSCVLGLQTLCNKFFGHAVSGFTTVILIVLILSSIIMISMGILGIYLSKVYDEVKNRPIFVIDEIKSSHEKVGRVDTHLEMNKERIDHEKSVVIDED